MLCRRSERYAIDVNEWAVVGVVFEVEAESYAKKSVIIRKALGNQFPLWPIRVSVPRFMKFFGTCLFTSLSVAHR